MTAIKMLPVMLLTLGFLLQLIGSAILLRSAEQRPTEQKKMVLCHIIRAASLEAAIKSEVFLRAMEMRDLPITVEINENYITPMWVPRQYALANPTQP